MHFHLATVFMLVPLLAAAPTPIIEQGVDITDTVAGAVKQLANPLTGGLPNLPTGNGKRQGSADITGKVTEAVGGLAGGLRPVKREEPADVAKAVADALEEITGVAIPELPTGNGKRQGPAEITGKVTEVVGGLAGGLRPVKREEPADVAKAVADALEEITGVAIPELPTGNGKRQGPADITGKVTEAVGGLAGGLSPVKREEPADVAKAVADALEEITGGALLELPIAGKREEPRNIVETVTSTLGKTIPLGGGLIPGSKREPIDAAKTLATALKLTEPITDKLASGKREPIDTLKDLAMALKLTKPITDKFASGKRDDGMDVTKELDELLLPVTDAFNKYYNKVYKLPEGQESQSEKRDGVDVASAAKSVIDRVIAGVIEA